MQLSYEDRLALRKAADLLENPSFASRITHVLGLPIEKGLALLPPYVKNAVQITAQSAVNRAMRLALRSMDENGERKSSDRSHRLLSGVSGAVGGLFGLPALAVELPVTTTLMLRSIGDIARSEGENLTNPRTQMACMEVFAYGGPSKKDDNSETGYYAVRAAMSQAVSEAAEFIAKRGLTGEGAPILVRFVSSIASRYGVTVSEKLAAQAIPVVGAVGGATVNYVFMRHYQAMARGHFTIRRLELIYGTERIREEYRNIYPG